MKEYYVIIAHKKGEMPRLVSRKEDIPELFDTYKEADEKVKYLYEGCAPDPDDCMWRFTIVKLEDL